MAEETLQHLRDLLASGRYAPESRLPPERELADVLGVNRTALRKALGTLEAEGRIRRHVGKGTFVSRPAGEAPKGLDEVTQATNPAEVLEARLILEPALAGLAALRATPQQLEHMEHCLRKGEAAADFATFELWDSSLHEAIAQAAQNALLVSLFHAVNALRESSIWGRLKQASLTAGRQTAYVQQHAELVDAIRDRDGSRAERLMHRHLSVVRRNMLSSQ